jgi:hypothetical protein
VQLRTLPLIRMCHFEVTALVQCHDCHHQRQYDEIFKDLQVG